MKRSLKFKITLPVMIIIFTLILLMIVVSIFLSRREFQAIMDDKGQAISTIAAESLMPLLTFEDKDGIKTNLKNLAKDSTIVGAVVFNPKGETLGQMGEKLAIESASVKGDRAQRAMQVGGKDCRLYLLRIKGSDQKELGVLGIAFSLETVSKSSAKINGSLVFFGIFALLGVALVSLVVVHRLIKPLLRTNQLMEELSSGEGDLTVRLDVSTKDEIGRLSVSFNNFMEKLQEIIARVKEASDSIYHATEEVSSGSEDLSSRTNEQAASITQTSTTLEKFTVIVRQNSQNSAEVRSTLDSFHGEIKANQGLMHNVTTTMSEINDSSKKIDNIINVINDISFQTNLLALNAAVEAARAGEAGRGFAVVAAEVRNLAQKTAESSKTIQEIVTKNVESTKKGMDLVTRTSTFFQSILTVMEKIIVKVNEIADGSRDQATGIDQINGAISQLENVINQNAALVEELSATSRSMKTHAMEMQELVGQFRTE